MIPPFPALSQGWEMLSAYHLRDRELMQRLRLHLKPSLWTVFDRRAATDLRRTVIADS